MYHIETGTPYTYKLWMNFRNKFGTGAVCGGISKSGHCIRGVNSIPSAVIGQPGHAALLYYNQNADGKGLWGIDNDVSGWAYSEKGERMPLGWGNDRTYVKGYNVPYVIMAQEALNDYNNLLKTEELLITVDVYNDTAEQEKIYRKAIETQSINLDAWAGLVKLYTADSTKTEEQLYNLVEEMMEELKCFPFPMYNLSTYLSTRFTSNEYIFKFTLLQKKILEEGKNYQDQDSQILQPGTTRGLAAHLLGQIDTSLATFSFDGADAGKIVLSSKFDGNGIRWDYNLDGEEHLNDKNSWKEIYFDGQEEHKHKLTDEEIEKITSGNDIYVHIVGVNYNEENLYKIDILDSDGLPTTIYGNDLENRIIAVNLNTEWRYTEKEKWTKYSEASPDLTGNKTIQVRQGATGVKLASDEIQTFTFTKDTDTQKRKYVQISHLSVHEYSTQSVDSKRPYYAPNAIDGNGKTLWHTDFRYNVIQQGEKPFITIKLDEPRYISALEFKQIKYKANDPDYIKTGIVYVSEDGEKWKEAGRIENCPQDSELRDVTFNESVYGQYIKLEMETYSMFASVAMINIFEDLTKAEGTAPTAGIAYSTTEKTNEAVIARLVNPSTKITITNNNGNDSYVFTQNGEFTFEFEDENGNKGTATANVTWIDKEGPSADVNYKLSDDKKLIAILDNIDEDVYLLDKNNNKTNYVEVEDGKVVSIAYLDESGETYKIVELDENKITKKITYKNTTGKVEKAEYYVITIEDGEIVNRTGLNENGENVTLTNTEIEQLKTLEGPRSNPLEFFLEKNEEYEFRLLDKASNLTYKNIKVDYIANDTKILASDISYSTTMLTNSDVIATITPYVIDMDGKNNNASIINNDGKNKYTFTENGEFTFEYIDEADQNRQVETHTAVVDWIDKINPEAQIQYSTKENSGKIVVTLVNETEDIIITNNGGKREYTFTENGEFTFNFQDKAGNKGTATAKVDWLHDIEGDIDGDREVTVNDLAMAKLHFLDITLLTDEELKRADIDKDGQITVADIAKMKLIILGLN